MARVGRPWPGRLCLPLYRAVGEAVKGGSPFILILDGLSPGWYARRDSHERGTRADPGAQDQQQDGRNPYPAGGARAASMAALRAATARPPSGGGAAAHAFGGPPDRAPGRGTRRGAGRGAGHGRRPPRAAPREAKSDRSHVVL